ncbi:AAA family ATPase [Pseudoalteromonas sp. SSMSWG5]|uniref:AAA family ATPase n=1 Tax=Pseudoalteromonas sp. SSMSWG5 TaxID=3139396 RepID=UPI003BA8DF60
MIKKLKFSNYQSYLNETVLDFKVPEKFSDSYFDCKDSNNHKYARVAAVFGANGSGKSSLLKPLSFISWFIAQSFHDLSKSEKIPFQPHFAAKNKPTNIEIDFQIDSPISESESDRYLDFKYNLTLTRDRVLLEELKLKTSRLYSRVFKREFDKVKNKYDVFSSSFMSNNVSRLKDTPPNCSYMSYLARLNFELFENENDNGSDNEVLENLSLVDFIYPHFFLCISNITETDKADFNILHDETTKIFIKQPEVFNEVKNLICKFDIGIKDIEIRNKTIINSNNEEEERNIPYFKHEYEGESYFLPIYQESRGTKSAYTLLCHIIQSINCGTLAILDEFDNDLHPMLTNEIIELFASENNKKNAQLIFTTHNTELLKTLRKQHVYFVEKDDSVSEAYRADHIQGLKERDNINAKYLSGALGGVPDIY